MMPSRANQLGQEKVRAMTDRDIYGVSHARSRIENNQPVRRRCQDAAQRGYRVRHAARQTSRSGRVGHGAGQPVLETAGRGDGPTCPEVRKSAGDREESQVVVDDNHSLSVAA
jgi:hypothetical protein